MDEYRFRIRRPRDPDDSMEAGGAIGSVAGGGLGMASAVAVGEIFNYVLGTRDNLVSRALIDGAATLTLARPAIKTGSVIGLIAGFAGGYLLRFSYENISENFKTAYRLARGR